MIGKTVAHHTIVDQLGAGGIGKTSRATGGQVRREVALKGWRKRRC